jgi:hypothetical protein
MIFLSVEMHKEKNKFAVKKVLTSDMASSIIATLF